jgi:hypothetical protein
MNKTYIKRRDSKQDSNASETSPKLRRDVLEGSRTNSMKRSQAPYKLN